MKWLVGVGLATATVILYVATHPPALLPRAPRDEALRARFEARVHDFEELRDILIALPQDNVYFSQDQIGGDSPAGRGRVACFEYEGQWHEWESRRPVALAEILAALSLSAERYGRVMDLVQNIDGGCARKITWQSGVKVEVGVWGGAGIWGVAKMIVFLDYEPGHAVVQSTDSDPWTNHAYARLGRPGWFIHAVR